MIGVLALAGCGDDGSAEPGYRERKELEKQRALMEEAVLERDKAEALARAKERETAELKAQVDALIAEMTELDVQMNLAQAELAAARSEAERATAQAKMSEIRARQKQVRDRLDRVKAGVKLKCPPDKPLC